MLLPFTADQFFAVFAAWNNASGIFRFPALALGAVVLVAAVAGLRGAGVVAVAALAPAWAAMGIGYHGIFFTEINPAAYLFAAAFALQAGLLVWFGLHFEGRISFDFWSLAGLALAVYALAGYAAAAWLAGHVFPAVPLFGTAPCPTVIFTLGLLLLTRPVAPAALYIIPLLWSLIGGSAAVLLGVPEDFGLIAAGVVTLWFLLAARWRRAPSLK